MSRNIRTNFLTDKATFGNSTLPIGSIVPIFKATDDKVTDNGVVTSLGSVVAGSGGGSGYVTDLGTIAGYPTAPITYDIPATAFQVGTDNISLPNHPFVEGDKLTVITTDQQPNKCKLGASIQSITMDNVGSGYTSPPIVQVTDNGSGPLTGGSFQAVFDSTTGTVTGINVIDGGTGYQFPVVTLIGGGGTNASATPVLATGGTGGVSLDKGFTFYVDVVNANTIKFARSNGDIFAGYYYNITDVGSNGTISVASSTGFGLTVGTSANLDGSLAFATIKKAGYGYETGDVVYILQPGSSGTARIEITGIVFPTPTDPASQYEGWLYCDGSEYNAQDFPLLYEVIENKYGGLNGTFNPEDFGSSSSLTFNVPDYKARKLVGAGGGVSGGGSPVSGNVISTVGATGGRWFFDKTQQEALFDIGNIVISGYPNITEFVSGTLTGEVEIQIGPLQEKMISSVPEHDHAIMTSQAPLAGAFEGSGFAVDNKLASYKDSSGQVQFFLPNGGTPLFHSHGVVDYVITDPTLSTFGNVGGIGETVDVTITATNIIGDPTGTKFNVNGHDLSTGYKIRVKSNDQSTQCVFDVDGTPVAFAQNTEWYAIRIDDDNFYLATSKYNAKKGITLSATTNGSGGQDIVLEIAYKVAGDLPADTVTVIQQPADTVYDINDSYTIGGKTIIIPGDTYFSTEIVVEQQTPGSYTVPSPTTEQQPLAGVTGNLGGSGGGGATSDVDGTNGGDSYYEFNYNGNQIQIVAEGGAGGTDGDAGGAGGAGGQARIVSGASGATNVTGTGTFTVGGLDIEITQYNGGNSGQDGTAGSGGAGATSGYITGAGGDGSRTLYTGTNETSQTFSTPSSSFYTYTIPATWPLDSLKAIIRGGGGSSGGPGDGDGNGPWWAGNGGDGKRITVNINPSGIGGLRVYVGGGGIAPNNVNTGGNPKYLGGSGATTGFSAGGNGGTGTGGGGGGGGGAASAVGTSVVMVAGAGGGGGGGAGGDGAQGADQNGTVTGNDGTQNLSNIFSGSGSNGGNSVCSGGGGGAGGGGVGFGAGIGGGGGAGNGSNARRDGYGGQRGQSGFRGSGGGTTASFVSEGNAGNGGTVGAGGMANGGDGSVEMIAVENQTFYGDGGGGGGSGAYLAFKFEATNINAGTMVIGQTGVNGGQAGQGQVGYLILEESDGGTGTSVTSGIFDSASPSVDYVQSGTGSGVNGGFSSTDGAKYLRFFGNEAVRFARSIPIDATSGNSKSSPINTVRIRVIRGNNSNGGETPNEPLELFASNDSATSFNKIGTISSALGPTDWTLVDIPLTATYQVSNLILEVRQTRSGAGNANNDNFGIDYISFVHDEVEQTITTYPSAKADLGIEFVTERIEPQGDPLNSAGLEVNEGTFTLSSAVKLNVDSSLQPDVDIPLLTRYHLVKYMIRAY